MPETDQTQPVDDQAPVQPAVKKDQLADFKAKIAQGPLPKLEAQVKAAWVKNKWVVVLIVTAIVLLVVMVVGTLTGSILGALSTKNVQIAPLPSVTPSARPVIPSIFDDLKQEVIDFNTILPDPAPPAVDQGITLDPPRR
jgi:hypothetical protein